MCAVERSIGSNFQPGFRLIDDMELGFISSSAAQDYIARLQEGLSDYELALNPTKTSIRDLPCLMETSWAPPLRSFTFRTSEKGMQSDLIRYFDCAYELHQKFPNEAVISYAISRLKSEKFSCESNMKLCENLVLQSCIAQPASLRHGLHLLMEFSKSGCQMRSEELEQALNLIAQHHAPLGHGGEVAWALWGLIEFNLPLTDETVSVVSTAADSICTLLLLHANSIGLVANPSLFSILESYMTESELEHERWLVSYEADVQGWLPTFDGKDNHVKSHKFFSKLKKAGVRFYDQSARGFPLIPHSIDTFVSG